MKLKLSREQTVLCLSPHLNLADRLQLAATTSYYCHKQCDPSSLMSSSRASAWADTFTLCTQHVQHVLLAIIYQTAAIW